MGPSTERRADSGASQREERETSGLTSRLMLAYAEREGGREAVDALLDRAGLRGREVELRDENSWFSFVTKIRLFAALVEVLGDPLATRHAGAAALDLSVGYGLKVALRALGSPRLVYQHVVRANAKFSARHGMELLDLSRNHARIRFLDLLGEPIDRLDCEYNIGLLSCVPALFGQPPARVTHPVCALRGADTCIYEMTWDGSAPMLRTGVVASLTSGLAVAAAALADPSLLPVAGAYAAGAAVLAGRRTVRARRARWRQLETEVAEQAAVADRLTTSLRDLVSELRFDEVLDKIVHNARSAVGGKQFALLVTEDRTLTCRSSSGLPRASVTTLEAWAAGLSEIGQEAALIEDVTIVPALARLAEDPEMPLRSVYAAPLMYRGEPNGLLVALAAQPRTFLPRDLDLVQSYALPAAIALNNARAFADQHALATRDPLTGLLNHREFHEAVERELERCRHDGGRTTIALFDLDGFKLVNDGFGHAEGDRLLCQAAEAFSAGCGHAGSAFRIGGDEFALVLPDAGPGEAEMAARRACDALRSTDARTDASYGLGSFPEYGPGKDDVLGRADENLYAMKCATAERHATTSERDGQGRWTVRHRDSLAVAGRRFEALIDHSSDLITVVSPTGAIEYQSRAATRLLGYLPSAFVGRHLMEIVHPDDLARIQAHFAGTVQRPGLAEPIVCRLRHADGGWRWVESYTNNLLHDPAVGAVVVHSRDVTERKDLEDRLRELAFRDPLTGLGNRTLLVDRLAHALAGRRRDQEAIAMLLVDVDDFKAINDRLGHAVGDEVLRTVAQRLAGVARAEDTVARLGDDEFALVLERVADHDEATAVAERTVSALRAPLQLAGHPVVVDATVGVAVGDAAADPEDLLRRADAALYVAKAEGLDLELYRPERDPHVGDRAALISELAAALDGDQLDVHLQPVADLRSGRVVAVEALVRWHHPSRGLLAPAAFLPVAEASGHIGALTRRVLSLALAACHRLDEAGHRLEVAINLSPASLEDATLVDAVSHELSRSSTPSHRLWFEITEGMLVRDARRSAEVVGRLAHLGSLSLDDFGTGHSSLTRLRQLPIRELKVDRSFVRDLLDDAGSDDRALHDQPGPRPRAARRGRGDRGRGDVE